MKSSNPTYFNNIFELWMLWRNVPKPPGLIAEDAGTGNRALVSLSGTVPFEVTVGLVAMSCNFIVSANDSTCRSGVTLNESNEKYVQAVRAFEENPLRFELQFVY